MKVPALSVRGLASLALVASLCASSAAYAWDWKFGLGNAASGSGVIRSETRNAVGFTGISLSISGLVEIRQGDTESVTIETDDNLLPLVETVVEHGTLEIRPAKPVRSLTTKNMKVTVHAKNIDSLNIAGAGDIHANALKGSKLTASIAGSGDMTIDLLETGALDVSIAGSGDFTAGGRAQSLDANIAGSGDIEAGNLDTKAVKLSIAGSGDAIVWARDSLNVSVAGSGDVTYFGDPEVKKSIMGSGSIKQLRKPNRAD